MIGRINAGSLPHAIKIPAIGTFIYYPLVHTGNDIDIHLTTGPDIDGAIIDNISNAVTAAPVPAVVWLFGPGLLELIGIARRRTGD